MNRRTGNIRRAKPKRRYHDRRAEGERRKGIDIVEVQGKGLDGKSKTYAGSVEFFLGNPETKAENDRLKAELEAAKKELEDAKKQHDFELHMARPRCACGHPMPSYGGYPFACRCGRHYAAPTLDAWAVTSRMEEIEQRLAKLEGVIRTEKP